MIASFGKTPSLSCLTFFAPPIQSRVCRLFFRDGVISAEYLVGCTRGCKYFHCPGIFLRMRNQLAGFFFFNFPLGPRDVTSSNTFFPSPWGPYLSPGVTFRTLPPSESCFSISYRGGGRRAATSGVFHIYSLLPLTPRGPFLGI